MIFQKEEHIDMIRNGLSKGYAFARIDPDLYQTMPLTIVKTQTRRVKRGIYQVGKDYAVQRKRGMKAESDIRIVIDAITHEYKGAIPISNEDAWAEGGYTPEEYEKTFRELNPKWGGWARWVFEFHALEVR